METDGIDVATERMTRQVRTVTGVTPGKNRYGKEDQRAAQIIAI